jgi:hypothetical protein
MAMEIPSGVDICCPPIGCSGNDRPRVFGERMKGREAICESEKYQNTEVGSKREWDGSVR